MPGATSGSPRRERETVAMETPARRATSSMLAKPSLARSWATVSSTSRLFMNSSVRVEDLIRGLVIQSGNDAANEPAAVASDPIRL